MSLRIEPFAAVHRHGFAALMEAIGHACFCRFWHFAGTKNEWLERCIVRPEENEAEQFADPDADDARGLVALEGERLVGWLKITPQSCVPKLLQQSPYKRRLTTLDHDVASLACFLVHPDARRRGVARSLLAAAPDFARRHGARWLEGYPRRAEHALPDAQAHGGPETLFREMGFELYHDEPPYPIWRLAL